MYTKWESYCMGSEGYRIQKDNRGIPATKIKEELRERLTPIAIMHGSFEAQKKNSELIATAVNACIKVNPNNPQAVAESIKDMYEALKHSRAILGSLKPNTNIEQYDIDNQLIEISKALAKAEGKEND